jgi:hypothetical protein
MLFREMAEVSSEDYPALFGVVHADDQDLSADYVADVQEEATAFLSVYRNDLSDDAKKILQQLNGEIPWA